jgi:hypothetical protein
MTYAKPTVVDLGTASTAILGIADKRFQNAPDADVQQTLYSTGGSYDLDE